MSWTDLPTLANLMVALATAWLAWVTYGVAKISRDALLLQTQPYLGFDGISLEIGQIWAVGPNPMPPALRIGLLLSNPGKVAVTYQIEDLSASLNGSKIECSVFLSRGGRIFPDRKETFFLPSPGLSAVPHAGSGGEISAKIIFWATPNAKYRLILKQQFGIKTITPELRWEWVALEMPSYEKA